MTIDIIQADYNNLDHCADLLFLLDAYAMDPMGGGEPLGEYSRKNLCKILRTRTDVLTLLCYVDGKPAGICNCVEGFSTFKAKPLLNIHDMGVVKEFRGLGISHKLLQRSEEIAKQRSCCKLTLEVLDGNDVAKQSYLKYGFSCYELDPEMGGAMFWEKPL